MAYSAHEHGPYVYNMSFLTISRFPAQHAWDISEALGLCSRREHLPPVWIGEFGSFYPQGTDVNRIGYVPSGQAFGVLPSATSAGCVEFFS